MIIRKCDKCGKAVDKLRKFVIQEVNPEYGYKLTTYDGYTVGEKAAELEMCDECTEAMGLRGVKAIAEKESIEDVLRNFVEVIVEDHSHEHD